MALAWWEPIFVIGAPVIRAGIGWAENALADGRIEVWEWKQLAVTACSVGLSGLAVYLGLNAAGIDFSAVGGASAGILFDMIRTRLKK